MNISELSIRRPVMATVLTLIILLFGLIGYTSLGVREYPSVDNPIISVSCSYPGANADVIENQITEPLEQNINGIPGIRSLSSVSKQGSSRITVEFELSVDLETAANDVRDKVSRAQRYLPRDCDPPTVSKADADASPILMVTIQSDKRSLLELSEIADLTVKEQLQTIGDVSSVEIWGEKRYSMRLWLDPVKMAGYGITPVDVKNALDRENVELPSGSIEGNTTELTIRTLGLMHTAQEFNDLIVSEENGRIIRFSDIGRAELGPQDMRSYMKMDGIPMVGVVVIPQPGANHIDIADAVYERLRTMSKDLPEDVVTRFGFDNTKFIRASIDEVKETVYVAFLLVIVIIFLFLRDWRVTLIPCVVIPVSLVGAFFVMYIAGFSINVLSMLAVVLAVGLVVDDAIVMTENIYIRIERGMTPKEAGIEGSKEIFFAVISTTITLVAVFFPIVFMQGTTGRLFREFSLVVTGAVLISAFAALTFTPMLATKMLVRKERQSWFYRATEPFFDGMNRLYARTLAAFMRRRVVAIPVVLLTVGMIWVLWSRIPSEMAPLEDRSSISINTRGAEGVTYEYIRDYTEDINRLVDSLVPEAEAITARVSSGSGNVRISLRDIADRDRSQMEIAEELSKAVRSKTMARAFVQQQSTFGGRRSQMPVQYVLQATNLEKLQQVLPEFMAKVYESPVFQMADVDLKFSKPEARITINRDKAGLMGVSTRDIAETLQYGLSGQRMGYFYMNGKQYEILGEINRQQRNKPTDLKSIYVRSEAGEMVQLDNLVSLQEAVAPPQLYRYNRFVSATVSAGLAEGKTIGQGLDRAGIDSAGFGYRRGGCRPRGDGCGRRRRHARLDPADALHRSGHVQLYFHRQTQKESMRRFLSLTWALCGLSVLSAQTPYTLKSCLETGLERNYSIRIARNDERISSSNATRAAAGALPTLDFSAGYDGALSDSRTRPRAGETSSENGSYDQTVSAGLDLEWTIFEGFRIRTDYRRLQELKAQGELETRIAIEDFVASLAAEYYNFVQQKIRLKNFRYAVSLSKERLRIVEARYRIGSFSRLDLLQARVDFNADSSQYITQQELVFASRIRLNELMAVDSVDRHILVLDSLIRVDETLDRRELERQMLRANASLLRSAREQTLAELDLQTLRSRNYPYLKLGAGYGYSLNRYGSGSTLQRRTLGPDAGLTLGMTIFDGNRRREQRNARIEIDNARLRTEQLELSLEADFSNFWQAYRNNVELLKLEEENLVAANENYEIAMERYLLGDLSGIEMREAQKSLLDAEERILSAQYNTKLCEISLLQISGGILHYLD